MSDLKIFECEVTGIMKMDSEPGEEYFYCVEPTESEAEKQARQRAAHTMSEVHAVIISELGIPGYLIDVKRKG